jgi:hypothetical protein
MARQIEKKRMLALLARDVESIDRDEFTRLSRRIAFDRRDMWTVKRKLR